jgi:uncharacterized protein YidB (DUF937 family)
MGLFDDLGKAIGGAAAKGLGGEAGAQGALVQALMSLLAGGGLEKLVGGFTKAGLGHVVESWISTGPNLPVSADQVTKALGSDTLGQLARQSGLDVGSVAQQLTSLLPGIVDKLSPGGAVPQGDALAKGLGALKGLF